MRVIVLILVAIAAIIVTIDGAWTLWNRYELLNRPAESRQSPVSSGAAAKELKDEGLRGQIITTNPDEIFWGNPYWVDDGFQYPDERYVVIPVLAQTLNEPVQLPVRAFRKRAGFAPADQSESDLPNRDCYGDSYSNVVIYDRQLQTTRALFDERLSIVTIQELRPAGYRDRSVVRSHIAIEVAKADSNVDGALTCKDFLKLVIYEFATGKLSWIDLAGSEPTSRFESLSTKLVAFGVGLDENNDGLHNPLQERVEPALLDLETGDVTRIIPPELIVHLQDLLDGNESAE